MLRPGAGALVLLAQEQRPGAAGEDEGEHGDDEQLQHGTTLVSVDRQVSKLEDKLKALPAKPGVYLFRDAGGDVLYIGKAKSLRPRVRSYSRQPPTPARR